MSTLLFSQGDLRDYLQSRNLALHEAVQREPEEHVLQVDVQEWATALGVVYSVEAPVLRAVEKEADPPTPSMVDVSHEQMRAILDRSQPALVAGTRTTVHVPFDGDAAVFRLRPSQFTYNPPQGDVATHEICLDLSWPNDRPLDVGSAVAGWLRVVEQYLVWARGDCEGHNRGLVSYAEAQIENRRRAVEQTRSVLTSAGIPIRVRASGA